MIFHGNRVPADTSHEISFKKKGKMSQNLSAAAVMIVYFRVKTHVDKLARKLPKL